MARQLQEAGRREDEKQHAERAAAGMDRSAHDEGDADEEADHGDGPDGEPDRLVANVREPVARGADEVGGGVRRDAEFGDVAPVVGQEGEGGEEGDREHEEPDQAAAK